MSRLLKATAFGFCIGILGVLLCFFNLSHDIEEDAGLALLFNLRGASKAPPEVVVVSIDSQSSERLNVSKNPDRWPRSLEAKLIETLNKERAAAIIFDLYFMEPRTPAEDDSLAKAIKKGGNVVLAERLRVKEVSASKSGDGLESWDHRIVQTVKPIEAISKPAFATAPFVLPGMPVRVNYYWTFLPDAGDVPTFPVVAFQLYSLRVYGDFVRLIEKTRPYLRGKLSYDAAARIREEGAVTFMKEIKTIFDGDPYLGTEMIQELNHSKLAQGDGEKRRLLKGLIKMYSGSRRRYLNYYGPPRTIETIPFYRALGLTGDSGVNKSLNFNDKVVFVGLSEKELAERRDSFHTVFSQANGVFISGVEIAATAFANFLEDRAVKPVSASSFIILIFAWGLLVGFICRMTATTVAALATLGGSAVYFMAAQYQFNTDGTWLPVVVPLFIQAPIGFFGALSLNYFETNKERQNIRNALSYYVPNEVVNQLAKNRVDMRRGGETVYGICLYADAAGYTSFSEHFEPRELRDTMHRYFEATFAPIHHHGGLVVDLKGDSILAIWKGARPDVKLRQQACIAALDLAKAVQGFNQRLEGLQLPTRIGLHAGELFLGNIGAAEHYEYGVTGDTVNTASRMDGLNKYLGTQVLASAEAIEGLSGILKREAGSFLLKGKTQPVVVYELLCRLEETDQKQVQACAIFADALDLFRRRAWREAQMNFGRCIELLEEDKLSQYYLKFCNEYLQEPPNGVWTSVIQMEEK
jgi:adenylate cyclase